MLKVENISKNFGDTKAVNKLSFSMKKGDIVGLLGPNGAGKTTTMRMISSYYYPTEGKVEIAKTNTQENTLKSQENVGYLPENNPLYLDMMVYDYLMMTGKFYGMKKDKLENRIKEVSESVRIQDKLAKPINELSKGYKQRVGLAAALLHNPSLLVLDEPTEGLDPNQREEIRKLIKRLSKDKAILISTHVMQEVKAMCNRVVVINNGELVVEGHPDSLTGHKTLELKIEGSSIEKVLNNMLEKDETVVVEDQSDDEQTETKNKKVKKVVISSNRELRPEISKLAAKNNWVIWEIQMQDSLEEVFEGLK